MKRINKLSPQVANQIAAGEVIERPASVVKELLENALDAGADALHIEIRFGGLNQIKVSDNGFGILAQDLQLAISPHATSKLIEINDLQDLTSMGFRGEALASIASVSRISVHSKPALQQHGMLLASDEYGIKCTPAPREQGTTIDVRDLFFNTPVRKSFLKSERLEFQAIEDLVKRFALSVPDLSIELTHNGKKILSLPKVLCENTRLARVQAIFGKGFVDNALEVNITHANMQLTGWISGPRHQLSQNNKQWVYLNRRMVKDKLIQRAIMQAYQSILYAGRYPSCLLYLNVHARDVDVNVHPTKHEVRFQNPRVVHDFIYTSINERIMDEIHASTPMQSVLDETLPVKDEMYPLRDINSRIPDDLPLKHNVFASRNTPVNNRLSFGLNHSLEQVNFWKVINSCFAIYELSAKKFYLVDVIQSFRQYCQTQVNSNPLPLDSRRLLVPMSVTLPSVSVKFLQQSSELLLQLGIQCIFEEGGVVKINTIPIILPWLDLQKLIGELGSPILDLETAIQYCLSCLSLDVESWSSAQHQDLIYFLQQNLCQTSCVLLDENTCSALKGDEYNG